MLPDSIPASGARCTAHVTMTLTFIIGENDQWEVMITKFVTNVRLNASCYADDLRVRLLADIVENDESCVKIKRKINKEWKFQIRKQKYRALSCRDMYVYMYGKVKVCHMGEAAIHNFT